MFVIKCNISLAQKNWEESEETNLSPDSVLKNVCNIDDFRSNKQIDESIDVLEQDIYNLSPYLLDIILQDKTKCAQSDTNKKKYIVWACDEYEKYGEAYQAQKEILPKLITKNNTKIIQPRILKAKEEQKNRTRKSAEVFTPSWICNEMNNLCDTEWFGRENVFNAQNGKEWKTITENIKFEEDKKYKTPSWQRYVDRKCLEITCGEAPFLVSRYDTTTGETLDVINRVGLLDRKLRIVNENTNNEADWLKWAIRAYESTYGYEYQGDNLLLARENLLWTFIDNYQYRWNHKPTINQLKTVAERIAWNVWQMDGLKGTIPFADIDDKQLELFEELPKLYTSGDSKIKDWRKHTNNEKIISFNDLKGDKSMKFDFVIGNPPYQEDRVNTSAKQVYNDYIDSSSNISSNVILITPARFLFNAGRTPKEWNQKMLNDEHFKVLRYEANSKNIFSNTDIKGGIIIGYRNANKNYGKIEIFTPYRELNNIKNKINVKISLSTIMYPYSTYSINEELFNDFPNLKNKLSNLKILTTNIFDLLSDLFFDVNEVDKDEYCCLLGRKNNERTSKSIRKKYINVADNFKKYKVIIPKSNGSGTLGETLSTPIIGEPLVGYTQSFLGIGSFETRYEAIACLKYIKSKFARAMLGILKSTQDNPPEKWKYVPLQDFTNNSDIDWSKSIPEIDEQLYAKYGLSEDEIAFIETNVKPME